nr:hypothetical transcript [Hymenolepis microstoma]
MIESDDSDFRIDVIQPEEVKKGLRPRIFGCVISGLCPLHVRRSLTGFELLANLQSQAEMERKNLKLNSYSVSMQYLLLISPLLGPRKDPINLKKEAEIAPLPVTTDSSGDIISLHPITACYKTRLTKETTRVLVEVAGVNEMVCKNIIRKLIEWLVQNAVPVCEGERSVTITPLAVVNAEMGDRIAKFPLEMDIMDPCFLNAQAE